MRHLGIDYGQRRIGLALSDPTGLLARPWKTIRGEDDLPRAAAALASEVGILQQEADGLGAVVIGLPRRLSGEANEQTRAVERLADHLRGLLTVPVVLQDERLTSREAESRLASREPDWRKRKAMVDSMAAAIILQDYLDARRVAAPSEDLET